MNSATWRVPLCLCPVLLCTLQDARSQIRQRCRRAARSSHAYPRHTATKRQPLATPPPGRPPLASPFSSIWRRGLLALGCRSI